MIIRSYKLGYARAGGHANRLPDMDFKAILETPFADTCNTHTMLQADHQTIHTAFNVTSS